MIFHHPLCACGWDDVYHPPERVVVIHFVLDRNPDPLDHWRGKAKVVGEKQVLGCGGWG